MVEHLACTMYCMYVLHMMHVAEWVSRVHEACGGQNKWSVFEHHSYVGGLPSHANRLSAPPPNPTLAHNLRITVGHVTGTSACW